MSTKKLVQYRRTIPKNREFFRVNLPSNKGTYQSGNGEGVWAIAINKKDFEKYKNNNKTGSIKVMILNDSLYYPPLKWGSTFDAELRGANRPVMNRRLFNKLQKEYYT